METPKDGSFNCPTCSSAVFIEDKARSLAEFSERTKLVELRINGTTRIEPPKFFLKCERCGYQIPQEAERPATVTYTFICDAKKSNEPQKC